MKLITDKQRAVLAFCADFFGQNDQLPTYQAITDHFGWASTNAAYEMMASLERRRLIERNAVNRMKFTPAGWKVLAEKAPAEKELSDER